MKQLFKPRLPEEARTRLRQGEAHKDRRSDYRRKGKHPRRWEDAE